MKSSFADRGKQAEKLVQEFLDEWVARSAHHEYERLVDTKAAGRIIKASAADFQYYASGGAGQSHHGLIEVKETKHEYRLEHGRITQLPRLRKREKCGGRCFVLLYHSTIKQWRVLDVPFMVTNKAGASWDLSGHIAFSSPGEALAASKSEVFEE